MCKLPRIFSGCAIADAAVRAAPTSGHLGRSQPETPHMKTLFTTSFLAAALALTGCSAGTDHPVDGESTEGASDALSAYGKKLVGAWKVHTPGSFEFDELVLESNGKFFWHHNIVCIK